MTALLYSPVERLIIFAFSCCISSLVGCQGPGEESIQHSQELRNQPKDIVTLGALIPSNLWSGEVVDWKPLAPEAMAKVLSMPMPAVTAENRTKTSEVIVRQVSGREMIYLPPLPKEVSGARDWAYENDMENWMREGKVPTLGEFLRAQLAGAYEGGDAYVRTYRLGLPRGDRASPQNNQTAPVDGPKLVDVIIVTQRYIAVVAVPEK